MEVQFGQNSHDEPNLLYKLQRKIKVFDTSDPLPNRGYNLVASASKYGAIFVGTTDEELLVYHLNDLVDKECEPRHLPVPLQEKPTHVAVNSDQELLAVTGGRLFVLFKVVDLLNQNVSPSMSVQFDVSPSTFVSDVKWNPCIPDTIAYAFYDGAIVICQAGQGQVKKLQSNARCICWSPKGKQLVVGNNDGTICQYKPDLSLMKSFPAPNLFQNAPVEVLAIHWISTFQFAAVYRNATDNSKPAVTIVNTPKGGQPSCLNYEDVCYSMGSSRPWYYYLQGFAQWNVILCSSSNSMEIATLGTADGTRWLPWSQMDEARPELPLTDKKQENYPIGIAIDTAAVHQLPWGENEKLPFMPTLHVLSQTGLLTVFNFINLNREAAQICTPITVVSNTPFPAQRQPVAPPAAAPQPKPVPGAPAAVSAPALFAAAVANAQTFGAVPSFQQHQQPQQLQHQQQPQQHQQQVAQPVKPPEAQAPVPTAQVQPKPAPIPQKDHTQELNAALKAEQELANKQKADQEFRGMLVSEVNEFQAELYDFVVKTRKAQLQFYRELHAIDTNAELQNIDGAAIKKECSLEELRSAIIALKLDLVRTCAVVAEARTHSDAKELDQWTQADPLTTKRVASVKKLAYYVQTQLEQAHSSLNYKWTQLAEHDFNSNKPGSRMTRPIMDDAYQALVKQQEILSRQAAVLKMLKSTLNECDGPVYKSTPILRSTPFKKDPLSKLTKNILNMSLEPQTSDNKNLLTPQKLDALRDMLSNHKTVKIKPVNVEMRDYLTTMRMSYERNMKEKAKEQFIPKVEPVAVKVQVKQEVKPQVKPPQQPPAPVFTPIVVKPALPPVTKTWFTEVPEPPSPQTDAKQDISFTISSIPTAPYNALKDVTVEVKKGENTMDSFMGQKICSPSNFNFSSVIVATPTSFTTKPISALNNMLNQFAPRTVPDNKSSETGEPVSNVKEENQMSNLFKISTSTPKPTQNIPDVLGNSNVITFKRIEPKAEPKPEKAGEKSKENVPGKSDNVILSIPRPNKEEKKANEPKPFSVQNTNKPLIGSIAQPVAISSALQSGDAQKSVEVKAKLETDAPKEGQKSETAPASSASIFATANATITIPKPKSMFGSAVASTTPVVPFQAISVSKPDSSSIFASANSTAPKTQPSSIFAANSSTPSNVFANSKPSIFGMAAPTPSYVTATPSASTVKSIESTSDTAVSTPSSVFGSKSIFGSSAFTATTTTAGSVSFSAPTTKSALESALSTPSSPIASTPTTTSQSIFSPTAATTQSGTIFGSVTSTTQPSVFGGTPTSTTSVFGTVSSASTSVFGSTTSTTKSAFGTTTATPVPVTFATPTTTKAPLPGSNTNTQASIFGGTTTQSSVFGSTTTPTSVFGSATTTQSSVFESTATTSASVFGSTTTATPAFGTTATTESPALGATATTQASIFGDTVTTQSSVFGSNTTTSASVFGSTASTPASVFGSAATSESPAFGSPPSSPAPAFGAATTQASVFGTPASTQASVFGSAGANQTSVFGSPATTQASVFGSPPTTQASVFGSPVASPAFGSPAATPSSVFGSAATAQPSVFGTPPTTQASVFGSPQTTQASVFGTPGSPGFGATSQASVFGTPASPASVFGTPTQSTQPSVFGTPTQTTQSSVFGTPATTAQASVFGSPSQSVFGAPATTTQSSIFGGGESLFASVSISTTSASSSSAGSIFGGGSTATSGFGGSNTNVFGSKSTFGQPNPAAEALFGGGGAGAGFGQTAPANNLWGSNNNSSGGFGSGFGQQPTTQASSVFGTGSFSAPSPPGQAFGSPTSSPGGFGSGFGSKAAFGQSTGFGSPTSSGFGAPAAFGGFSKSPGGFGGSASFGGAPAFGAPPAFGGAAAGPVFGGAAPAAGFGSPTQSNAMFESLATQNTLSFGNLAQQTPQPAQTAPSFNTSPSFTSWRG